MNLPSALLITKQAIKGDPALQPGGRGDRKLLVTELYSKQEEEAVKSVWKPPTQGNKCPVQLMQDTEIAVFTHRASQDRHSHRKGTEVYTVLEGKMVIQVEGEDYRLSTGDTIVVNPNAVHEVIRRGQEFLCQVVTVNCGGVTDKYIANHSA